MQRITLALVVAVALAAPVAAQESAPAPGRRGTIGAVILHFSSYEDRQWPYVGFDGTFRVGRFEVQATYFRDTVRSDDWTSTLEWYSGGIICCGLALHAASSAALPALVPAATSDGDGNNPATWQAQKIAETGCGRVQLTDLPITVRASVRQEMRRLSMELAVAGVDAWSREDGVGR